MERVVNFQQLVEIVSDFFDNTTDVTSFFINKTKIKIEVVSYHKGEIIDASKVSNDDTLLKNLLMRVIDKKEKIVINKDNCLFCLCT